MNKVILCGRLTRDPEARNTTSGIMVANASLATSEVWTDANGERKQKSEFHNLVLWRKSAENIVKYCHKGSQLLIEGKLTTEDWVAQDGSKRYTTKIMVDSFRMLDSKPQEARREEEPEAPQDNRQTYKSFQEEQNGGGSDEVTRQDDGLDRYRNLPPEEMPPEPQEEEIRVENIPF